MSFTKYKKTFTIQYTIEAITTIDEEMTKDDNRGTTTPMSRDGRRKVMRVEKK